MGQGCAEGCEVGWRDRVASGWGIEQTWEEEDIKSQSSGAKRSEVMGEWMEE